MIDLRFTMKSLIHEFKLRGSAAEWSVDILLIVAHVVSARYNVYRDIWMNASSLIV